MLSETIKCALNMRYKIILSWQAASHEPQMRASKPTGGSDITPDLKSKFHEVEEEEEEAMQEEDTAPLVASSCAMAS